MTKFRVLCSTVSPADIAVFVREKYALAANCTCKLLKTGINHTYRVDSNDDRFVFRVYSYGWRSNEEITEELNLLLMLKENGISVSYPIADISKNFIQNIEAPEGSRPGALFSFAPGNKLHNYPPETHFEIGRLMAKIHCITNNLQQQKITYSPDILLNRSLDNIRLFLSEETSEMQFLVSTLPLLEKELSNADHRQLRKGIVHLDIWFDNLNITDDNKITLFDFDFCGNGWLCLDIAYYVLQLYNTEKNEPERRQKTIAFYNGYESIEKITDEEKRLVPILGVCLYYFYLGVQCQRFNNWSNTFLNEVYLKRYINGLIKNYYDTSKTLS